jgi:hypothetical protein
LDWLARTYAPQLLAACGRTADGSTLAGSLTVDRSARLNALLTRLTTYENACRADYDGDQSRNVWDDDWQIALDYVFTQIVDGLAAFGVPLDELLTDTDVRVKTCVKQTCRALELAACRFLAGGGTLP